MGRILRKGRPTPALVVACVAVVAALGGVAYAAIGKNSVKSSNIAPGAVKTSDLAKQAVKTGKVANGAIKAGKIADGAVTEAKLGDGSVTNGKLGSNSVDSAKISDGAVGTADLGSGAVTGGKIGSIVTRTATTALPDNTFQFAVAVCAAGEKLIGGGANFTAPFGPDLALLASRPALADVSGSEPGDGTTFQGWRASAFNETGATGATNIRAWAVCVQ
jgi:hypothetical protein